MKINYKSYGVLCSLLGALCTGGAYADLASTQYVQSGVAAVEEKIGTYYENYGWDVNTANTATITDAINEIAEPITNSRVANHARIGLRKLDLPTVPQSCKGAGNSCALIYNGDTGMYTWENLGRNGDTAPTGGTNGQGYDGTPK